MSSGSWQGYPLPRRATILAFSGVMLGMLLAALNQTIVATALPQMVADLGGLSHYSWVFSAYMLASTVTVPIWGRLSDIYGRRRFFALGIVIFMAGALVGATANSMSQLVIARGVQGLGAGALIPLAMAVIGDLIPPSERGKWQGMVGVVFGLASVLGPASGGWIVDHTTWRWVFIPSLPLGCLALGVALATLKIPPHPDAGREIDYGGAALLMGGLSAGLLALVWGGQTYPWGSVEILGLIAVCLACLAWFVWHERRVAEPIVPLQLFRRRLFSAASATGFLTGVAMFGTIMFVPLFVQGAVGDSATSSGIVLTPLMLAMIATSVISGQLISRRGRYRWALLTGPLVMMVGFGLLATLGAGSSSSSVTVAMIVMGLGLGLLMQNLVLVIQNSVPSRYLGVATSSGQFFRAMGGTVGVTAFGAILTSRLGALGGGVAAGTVSGGAGPSPAAREAIASAIHPVFVIGLPLMALAFLTALLIEEIPLRRSVREEASESGAMLEAGLGQDESPPVPRPAIREAGAHG